MPIYIIGPDDNIDELELELEYQATLTVDQRYKMMIDHGYKKPFEIIK